MALVDLDAIPQVPLDFVNADHREEARLLNEVADAILAHRDARTGPEPVVARFEALFEHTQAHFGREEQAMRDAGFPPYPVHRGEHERVLEQLATEGRAFAESGDVDRLWAYVSRDVPAWFIGHIQSMDLVTAQFVSMRGRSQA
jgi:hemerythrin